MADNEIEKTGGSELIGRERIRGASRVIAEGALPERVSAEQVAQVAADVETFRRAHKISRKQIAEAVSYSESAISEFLSGKYAATGAQVAIDLDSWLVEESGRRSRPSTTQFVWTNVAMMMKSAANWCLDHQTIGLVFSPDSSGLGKTMALQAYHQELGPRRSTLVRLDKVDCSPTGLLKKICHSMAMDDSGSNLRRFTRIVDRLKGRSHILLVDQVHNLRFAHLDKPLYILSDLHDATKTAQLWTGTSDLVAYLDRQRVRNVDESLAQIRSRIFPCIDLLESVGAGGGGAMLVTIDQVREMFAKNQLRIDPAAGRFLCKLCNTPDSGCIRLAVRLVEYATMLGQMRSKTEIDVPLLQEALRCCVTSARAELLVKGIEEPRPARAAMAG